MSGERWHGSAGGYTNHRCRCDDCRRAWNEAVATWRVARKLRHRLGYKGFKHGATGYREWNCRCTTCRAGAAADKRRERAAKRAA